jgi:hypothetical protein
MAAPAPATANLRPQALEPALRKVRKMEPPQTSEHPSGRIVEEDRQFVGGKNE